MSTAASNLAMASGTKATFYGWHVVAAVFVLATFGWGLGFYGPPVYLHAVHESRGWSLNVVSTAVTVHFLFGAIVIANLPRLYRRSGLARRLARAGDRRGGLGAGARTVAAFCCDAIQRRRLGDHGSGRGQCYRCAVVCAQAAGGASVGVQWVEHRRRCFLAALGGSHRITGVSIGRHCDRCRRGRDNLDFGRSLLFQNAGIDGAASGRRCTACRGHDPTDVVAG